MSQSCLVVDVRCEDRLCCAMQQNAVPWLHAVTLRNTGPADLRDLQVAIDVQPSFVDPLVRYVDALPAGGSVELTQLDARLSAQALANALERQRADLVVTVRSGLAVLATATRAIDVLAYNEWPGLQPLPALLAAFVLPNHPALAPLLRDAAARLQAATGSGALDGGQRDDPQRAAAMAKAVHDAVVARGIVYVNPPPSFERRGQKVRTPEQVLGDGLATCLDLALLYAALLEHAGLRPIVVLQRDHAFAGVWLAADTVPQPELGPAVELRKRADLGALLVVETTLACSSSAQPFAAAQAAARKRLDAADAFVVAIDVAACRSIGIQPLPVRTSAFAIDAGAPDAAVEAASAAAMPPAAEAAPAAAPAAEAQPPRPEPPKDRLEHWKGKLLDLTLFNRLLNFVETKKTVRLCGHDLAALEDRLQGGGRVRVLPRPSLGEPGEVRDLALAQQRTGRDLLAGLLADELDHGRLRADLDGDDLDRRLVEIFRHARTSLEESGANTLYLAIGFLKWFETPQSDKPRRAPLLLLPLLIERTSVQEGFRLALDDAEPRLNQTLLQMLQHDHDLRVAIGEQPPEDERGVDVRAVLDAFRAAVVGIPRWEVEETAWIGFFSFTKYLMWLDLAARDELLQSPVLRHLVQTPGQTFAQDVPEPVQDGLDDADPADLFCPKDADSSQLCAVLAGAAGRTFVLEGPPGTGKSQTITNLVAQSLAHGRRVLFVAEKRAALEVVQRRLAEVGLGPFCLELHSSKSGPKAVLEQLRRALELGARREPAEWRRVAAELQEQRERLNAHVRALHRRREHGGSVFAAIAQLVTLRDAARVPMPDLLRGPPADVAAARAAVADLAAAAGALGVPADEAWWGVRRTDWTPALARDVVPVAERLQRAAAAMAAAIAPVAAALGLDAVFGPSGPSRAQLERLLALAALFQRPSLPPAALVRAADWRTTEAALVQLVATGRKRDALWAPLAERWQPSLLEADLDRLHGVYRAAADAFFPLRWWRLRGPRRELAAVAVGGAVGAARAVRADLEKALQVRAESQRLADGAPAAAVLGAAWRDGHADWEQVDAWLAWVRGARELLVQIEPGALHPGAGSLAAVAAQLDGLAGGANVLPPQLGALRLAHDEFGAALQAAAALLDLDRDRAFGTETAPGCVASTAARAARWLASVPRLREHCAYERCAQAASARAAGPLVESHVRGELATAALQPAFERAFLEGWLDQVHAAEPELARFAGREHERAIERFRELDRRAIQLAAEVTVARLCAQLPQLRDTNVESSELGILERELKKQRRHRPVRRLLAEIPGLLGKVAPCVLMSPLSVAQFLGRSAQRFDTVVFDEASQIPMWDAASSIGRGRSLVVVGDSRQLPPTTFFQRQAQGDEILPDEIPEDLESVLDECATAGLPRMHLDWHYRSRHESLIAFSNHHYYQNRLLTFPAPECSARGIGVHCVRVAGVYDRGASQTNRVEAEALVAEVAARLRDPERGRQSLGVVTFSSAQQVLIEDLLDRARAEHPELEPHFTTAAEPVFVKNLENVQGDERDVILFSICYGPDQAGKVHENYGPLNQQGGERRLNVAVTRARRELCVFTSLRADQIANRTQALGARHLRTFLDYAERGQPALAAAVAADPARDVESPFEAAVRDALVRRGHEVHAQVGCSGYRIDLAVVDPDAAGRYLLGIECDGASYHAAATARDRDRLRAAVLEGLGWRLHRIWSSDFWQDPQSELERVEAALVRARAAVREPVARIAAASPVAPPPPNGAAPAAVEAAAAPEPAADAPADPHGPRPYVVATLAASGTPEGFASPSSLPRLRTQAAQILAAESPIAFARFADLLATAWGIQRVTERVRERARGALPSTCVVEDSEGGAVLWVSAGAAETFAGFRVPDAAGAGERAADEIPVVEVGNAMAWLLRQHHALSADDLAREAARAFGITRLGTVVRAAMARALESLLASGRAVRDGEVVRAPS